MKKATRILALLLVLVMVFALTACGETKTESKGETKEETKTESGAPSTDATGRTIGINNLMMGGYALDVLVNSCEFATTICGDELQEVNDEGNVEKIVSDLENFIASGVDAVLWFGLLETNFAVGPQKCEDAGVPIAFYDKIPTDPALIEEIRNMECFAGGVGNSDYQGGRNMGEFAVSKGWKKALICGAEVGDTTHDPRINGFTEVFTAAGGEIVATTRAGAGSDTNAAVDNMISANPDADCFFASGGDYGLSAVNVCKAKNIDTIGIMVVDIGPDLLPYLVDGSIAAGCGAHWVSGVMAAIMLENHLDGKTMVAEDGLPAILAETPLIVVPAEMADLYERFWIDEFPYEEDEIKQLLYRYNPDVTVDDISAALAAYSIEERLLAKYEAGKVTAEELKAVGIDVG